MIAAHAAEEDKINGIKSITPYWHTLKTDGLLNEKFPGGVIKQKNFLRLKVLKLNKKVKNILLRIIKILQQYKDFKK